MKTALIRTFLEERRQPLASSAEIAEHFEELSLHAPELCLNLLSDSMTHVSQKAALLAALIRTKSDSQAVGRVLRSLPDAELLQVLDGLRQRRVNGRRAREVGLPRIARPRAAHPVGRHATPAFDPDLQTPAR